MKSRFKSGITSAAVLALLSTSTLSLAPAAQAETLGTKSLAAVLTAKASFDTDPNNYDILTAAVLAVLKAKPNSPVKALTDGSIALTAFIPNDGAFQKLVSALTNKRAPSESATFDAVAGLGIDTVEQVLEYHVVPGGPILSPDALKANGAILSTVLSGKTVSVAVVGTEITLSDQDPISVNPKVILSQVDINSGNKQIAHGIDNVLLPAALLSPLGSKSLASVLTAKSSFDSNSRNFDILTAAVLAVLKAKPDSDVKILADGTKPVTAFIPNDGAFRYLVLKLTKKNPKSEKAAFATVASLGIPAVEQILLYHVVPGATIVSEDALKANGATLQTAAPGKTIKVSVTGSSIKLVDYSKLGNPQVILSGVDINRGNLQIAHAINFVLLPNK